MLLNVIYFLFTFSFGWVSSTSVRIMFARCAYGGFTCTSIGKNAAVVYQCPVGTNDITFYLHSFSSPSNIETLTIQNCTKVTLLVRCTGEKRNMEVVRIKNVKHLLFERTNYLSTITPHFFLENIDYIETIPSFTFSQYIKPIHSAGCFVPTRDFGNFSMTNVTIDTVESNAFYMPSGFRLFEMTNVRINRLQNSAIFIRYDDKKGQFVIKNSTIGILEHLAIQLLVRNVTIANNKFIEISSGGINGTIESFSFNDNTVNTLQPHAFSTLSKDVAILSNRIEYLKSGALERISPGLLEDSGRNFGSLRFSYLFKENYVHHLDAGSLQPDVDSYNNVASEVALIWNQFLCTCENIAWLVSELGHGANTAIMSDLYETLLFEDSKNFCAHSCQLPLSSIKRMVENGKCNPVVTTEFLCEEKRSTQTINTVTKKPKATNTYTTKVGSVKNRTAMASRSSASKNRFFTLYLLVIGVIRKFIK